MKQPTLGLSMIVRNEESNILTVLGSALPYVDAVYITDTGSTDSTKQLITRACSDAKVPLTLSDFEWVDDFAAARNYNLGTITTDWFIWLDADDVLIGGEHLKDATYTAAYSNVAGLYALYNYDVNEKGVDNAPHMKLRVAKTDLAYWECHRNSSLGYSLGVHENLYVKAGIQVSKVDTFRVLHKKTEEAKKKSGERNLSILRKMRDAEKKYNAIDPRTVYYLGRELWITGNLDEAEQELLIFLSIETGGADYINACSFLADYYKLTKQLLKRKEIAIKAMAAEPENPFSALLVAGYYYDIGEYRKCLEWVKVVQQHEFDIEDGGTYSPVQLRNAVMLYQSMSLAHTGRHSKAKKVLRANFELLTKEEKEKVLEISTEVERLEIRSKIDNAVKITGNLIIKNNISQVNKFVGMLPADFDNLESFIRLKKAIGKGRKHQANDVTIYCGSTIEPFTGDTLATKGMGGSETAVVEITRRLQKMGYDCQVYNGVKSEQKDIFGVTYKPAESINWADSFNIFISWRNPILFGNIDIDAGKKFLWLHDVPEPAMFTPEVISRVDKIMVLSKFHRQFLDFVPEDKFYYTSNGVDTGSLPKVGKKDANKLVYCSSYDRGLENILSRWADIRSEKPDWELHVAYGWETFDAIRNDPGSLRWKKYMEELMSQPGVIHHGRLSKGELYKLLGEATYWVYPTNFDEINCIVAQEAQSMGAYPVVTAQPAIKERLLYGSVSMYPVNMDDFISKLLDATPEAPSAMIKKARKTFSWGNTAKAWANDLFYGEQVTLPQPLVSVICVTIRPGLFRVLKDTLAKQTYKNFELIVVDGRYEERKAEVKEYMKDVEYPFLHIPDPTRDMEKYPYGLCHALNAALYVTRGSLQVHIQDFIEIPPTGIEQFVELHLTNPDSLLTGVDKRLGVIQLGYGDLPSSIDVFNGGGYELGAEQYKSIRIWGGDLQRVSYNPYEWELNYAAAPTHVLEYLGGWDHDWDTGFGYDNTELASRYMYLGGEVLVDETNVCSALSHWDLFPGDKEGVPHRTKKTNDKRFANWFQYLQTAKAAQVRLQLAKPSYDPTIWSKINNWLKNKK